MSSKIDHKELQKRLKEDEVAVMVGELSHKARSIFQQHGNTILLVIGLIIIGYIAYQLWQKKSNTDFVAVQNQFAAANALIVQENFDGAIQQFGALLNDFPNSGLSPVAYLLRADCYYQKDEYELALHDYQAALPGLSGGDVILAQTGLIQTYRSLNRQDDALGVVQSALNSAQSDELKNQLRYLEASCYKDKGDNAKALEVFHSMDTESSWFSQARQHIEWLEAEAVSSIN